MQLLGPGGRAARGGGAGGLGGAARGAEPVLEFEEEFLGALLADAGDGGERLLVAGGHRAPQGVGVVDGEHRLGQARADAAGGLEEFEGLPLVVVGEAVERQGVLADDEAGGEAGLFADAQAGEGVRGALDGHADPADLHHRAVRGEGGDGAAD